MTSGLAEDPNIVAMAAPYVTLLNTYNNTVLGSTSVPIDTLQAFTQETNGANLQADASVWELEQHHGIPVDFHLSGAMTNKKIAENATPSNPYTLKVSDMFSLMPYENSLVVMEMNGPQLKAVLERAYRNYYYYKYVPGYGGYSYYTTCMIDTNMGNQITYNDVVGAGYDPTKQYVVSLVIGGVPVDFNDASKYYRVSTVNYLAAGSCNFNDNGQTLWPLDQIVNDTQYYVRDAVINYIPSLSQPIAPAIEGRLKFINDADAPVITITSPEAKTYLHTEMLTLNFGAMDAGSGVKSIWADLDGTPVVNGQVIDLFTMALGNHTLTVNAMDNAYNQSTASVTFTVGATVGSLKTALTRLFNEGKITNRAIYMNLMNKLTLAEKALTMGNVKLATNHLTAFINEVRAQSGKFITPPAAALLIADAKWVINQLNPLGIIIPPQINPVITIPNLNR